MTRLYYLLLLACLAGGSKTKAKQWPVSKIKKSAAISVHLQKSCGDTILFYCYKYPNEEEVDQHAVIGITNKEGIVKFNTPAIGIMGCRIVILNRSKRLEQITDVGAMIEPSDRIYIRQEVGDSGTMNYCYTGKGSAKFRCLQQLCAVRESENQKREEQKAKQQFYNLNNIKHFCSISQYRDEIRLLKSYLKSISFLAYETLRTDIIGRHHYIGLYELINLYARSDSLQKKAVVNLFHQAFSKPYHDPLNITQYSDGYLKYLFERSYQQVIYTKRSNDVSILDLYRQLVSDYKGGIRDQLIFKLLFVGYVFYHSLATQSLDSIWQQALLITKNPSVRSFIAKRINHKSKGQPVCDLYLSDTNDVKIQLSRFIGKVLLVDVWFTGCAGCVNYSTQLEKNIYPFYENDPDIIFVSINTDLHKEEWLNSLRKGKYTRPGNLNLNTNGRGIYDPFTLYYDIQGGPTSLLIDKNGKIFSGSPPLQDMKMLKAMIDEALQ